MNLYDLAIIGGGPAGYFAAERAAENGFKCVLFEENKVGGVCLNEGCIPTKTLLQSAKIFDNAKNGARYGVIAENISLDHSRVMARKNRVIRVLTSGIEAALKNGNITVVKSRAYIKGFEGDNILVEAENEAILSKRLLIASGSEPFIPDIPGLKESMLSGIACTSREILEEAEVPESLVVIGGGIVGLEMASYFCSAGSKVTVIEMLDRIAGNSDKEISSMIMTSLKQKGIAFHLNSRVTGVKENTLIVESEGREITVAAGKILVSVGRRPKTLGTGLENIGVITENGAVKTDGHMMTNVRNVYAAGDVNGKAMLAHTAYREAEAAVNHMADIKDEMSYRAIPQVLYLSPEAAFCGESEESAAKNGLNFECIKLSMRYSGRFMAENDGGDGVIKLIIDKTNDTVMGVAILAPYASEIIAGCAVMIENQMKVEDIKKTAFPHPGIAEIIKEALYHRKG